jgi:hypothetical protein
MKNFEAFTGSAVWIAVSVLMAAAALEPVEIRSSAQSAAAKSYAAAASGDSRTPRA